MTLNTLILPIALSLLSYNVLADELRSISPETIRKIESEQKLSVTAPLAASTLIIGKDEKGGYVFSKDAMKSAITKIEGTPADSDPLTSQVLRELLGNSTTVHGVKIEVMKAGTQDI